MNAHSPFDPYSGSPYLKAQRRRAWLKWCWLYAVAWLIAAALVYAYVVTP